VGVPRWLSRIVLRRTHRAPNLTQSLLTARYRLSLVRLACEISSRRVGIPRWFSRKPSQRTRPRPQPNPTTARTRTAPVPCSAHRTAPPHCRPAPSALRSLLLDVPPRSPRPPPPSDAPLRPPARCRQPCALRDGSHVTGLPDTARRGRRILLAPAVAGAQPAEATLTRTASPNPTRGHGPARPWPGRDRSLRRCPRTALLPLLC
jgi:hypothetical protein